MIYYGSFQDVFWFVPLFLLQNSSWLLWCSDYTHWSAEDPAEIENRWVRWHWSVDKWCAAHDQQCESLLQGLCLLFILFLCIAFLLVWRRKKNVTAEELSPFCGDGWSVVCSALNSVVVYLFQFCLCSKHLGQWWWLWSCCFIYAPPPPSCSFLPCIMYSGDSSSRGHFQWTCVVTRLLYQVYVLYTRCVCVCWGAGRKTWNCIPIKYKNWHDCNNCKTVITITHSTHWQVHM